MASFFDWFSQNKEALSGIGAAFVVVTGGLWQVYLHFEGKKSKQKSSVLGSSPNSGKIRIEVVPAAALSPTQRPPLVVIEGKYRPSTYPKEQRQVKLTLCAFSACWCILLFWFISGPSTDYSLFLFPLLLFLLHRGVIGFFSQLALLIGKACVYVDADMIVILRSVEDDFSNHTIILASDWRFDGEVFVSRKDGTKMPVPELPEFVSSELARVLSATWR
jgi:hypothetical protein